MQRFAVAAALTFAALPAAADEPATESKSVLLHVSSPDAATVTRDDTGATVCTAPCDTAVPDGVRYRIVAGRPSLAFELSTPGRADVRVKPASNVKFWLGVGAVGLGTGLAAAGTATLLYAVGHRAPVPGGDGVDTDNSYTNRMTLGAGLILGGVIAGIVGTATILSNARAKVRGDIRPAHNASASLFAGTF